jgi:hypothetical protein
VNVGFVGLTYGLINTVGMWEILVSFYGQHLSKNVCIESTFEHSVNLVFKTIQSCFADKHIKLWIKSNCFEIIIQRWNKKI